MVSSFELNLLEPYKRLQQLILKHWIEEIEIPEDKAGFLVKNGIFSVEEIRFFEIHDISDEIKDLDLKVNNSWVIDVGGFSKGDKKAILNLCFSLPNIDSLGIAINLEVQEIKGQVQKFIDQRPNDQPFIFSFRDKDGGPKDDGFKPFGSRFGMSVSPRRV